LHRTDSAKVVASRYVKAGILIRLKRNLYILQENWSGISTGQTFTFANLIQAPSYISLMTALDYYEISTQMQQNFLESIAIKRTKSVDISGIFLTTRKLPANFISNAVRNLIFSIKTIDFSSPCSSRQRPSRFPPRSDPYGKETTSWWENDSKRPF